jgi:hypothetical protein
MPQPGHLDGELDGVTSSKYPWQSSIAEVRESLAAVEALTFVACWLVFALFARAPNQNAAL